MIWLIALTMVALAAGVILFVRSTRTSNPRTKSINRRAGFSLALVAVLILGIMFWPENSSDASAAGEDPTKSLTIDVQAFNACPEGVKNKEPVWFVRGSNVTHKHSVMPSLPTNDPDAVIEAIFGPRGYACLDPLVAVGVSQIQEGLLKFLEREDVTEVNQWVAYFVSNPKAWEKTVDEAVKRFDGLTWDPNWTPEDGDATFLIADAQMGQQYPRLVQRVEGVPSEGFPAYRFSGYWRDSRLLKDLALIQETGWLALPEGQFAETPVIEQLEQPLVTPDTTTTSSVPPEQQESGQTTGAQAPENQSDANDGGGGNATGGGTNSGTQGGKGGGSGSGCGDSGCGTGGGGGSGGNVGTGGSGGGCGGSCGGGGSTTPTTTAKPTTVPPTAPPTTRPPPTTQPPPPPPPSSTTTPPPPPSTTVKSNPATTTTVVACDPTKFLCF